MITEEAFMDIVALHRQGHSIRFIAKKLGMHRNTVKKFIEGRRFPAYDRSKRGLSIIAPFVRIILDWLSQDDYRASWVFERLKPIGYAGSYETVKKFIRPIKEQQARIAYARFETMPGLQAQVDWADFQIAEPNGRTNTVYLFILVLGYCRAIYAEFVNRCTLESFLDGHIRAFRYLGGVPAELLYDNMKHVVIRHLVGKVAFNPEILHFAHHYGFAPKACPPYAAWVKGKVERPVDYLRESFWRGYAFSDLQTANRDLHHWLDTVANRRIHGTHRQPVIERWQQDVTTGNNVTLKVRGITGFDMLNRFKNSLRFYVRGLSSVTQRDWYEGFATLELTVTGKTEDLAQSLSNKNMEGILVRVVGLSANSVTVELSEQ